MQFDSSILRYFFFPRWINWLRSPGHRKDARFHTLTLTERQFVQAADTHQIPVPGTDVMTWSHRKEVHNLQTCEPAFLAHWVNGLQDMHLTPRTEYYKQHPEKRAAGEAYYRDMDKGVRLTRRHHFYHTSQLDCEMSHYATGRHDFHHAGKLFSLFDWAPAYAFVVYTDFFLENIAVLTTEQMAYLARTAQTERHFLRGYYAFCCLQFYTKYGITFTPTDAQ